MRSELDLELKELVPHRSDGLPLQVYRTSDVYYPWHEEYEFLYLEEGAAQCVINGRHLTLTPGHMVLVQGGVLHMYRLKTPGVMTAVVVHPSLWHSGEHSALFDGKLVFQQLFSRDNPAEAAIMEAVRGIDRLLKEKSFGYGYRIGAALSGIFAAMLAQGMYAEGTLRSPRDAIAPMLAYVHRQYVNPLTLDMMAEKFHYSKSYIIQLFRKKTGLTPIEYLKRYRLEVARRTLLESDHSILDISLRCGFPHVGYFIRSFKAHTGLTPGAYRRGRRGAARRLDGLPPAADKPMR